MASASDPIQQPEKFDRRRVVVLFIAQYLVLALLLFLAAGSLGWRKGWLFLLVNVAFGAVILPYVWRVNPGILVARVRMRWAKRWDKIIVSLMFVPLAAVYLVAAFDDGRFHWLPMPWWACGIGYVLLAIGMGLGTWVAAVNEFAEGPVRDPD